MMQKNLAALERARPWLILGGLAATFLSAAWVRFSLPQIPLFNPDAWGYFGSALSFFAGQGFPQIHQRDFFYPTLLLGMLKIGGVQAIAFLQHFSGLLAGVFWWVAWKNGTRDLPPGILRRWLAPFAGIALLWLFLVNTITVFYEQSIRPESVFPLFALAQIACATGFLASFSTRSNPTSCNNQSAPFTPLKKMGWRAAALLAGTVFSGFAAMSLKPSWTLAWTGVAFALLAAARLSSPKFFLAVALAGCSAGTAGWMAFSYTTKTCLGWIPQQYSSSFLAKTLVSVHAPQILAFWEKPPVFESLDETQKNFFVGLRQAMETTEGKNHSYTEILHFDPDYIFYQTPLFTSLPIPPENHDAFLKQTYLRALKENPAPFAKKFLRQMWFAYTPPHKLLYSPHWQMKHSYAKSLSDIGYLYLHHSETLLKPMGSYREASAALAKNSPKETALTPVINAFFLTPLVWLLLPSFLLCLLGGFWGVFRKLPHWILPATWGFFSLGATATTGIVHSFDIARYAHNLIFLHLLVIGGGCLLLASWATKKRSGVSQK